MPWWGLVLITLGGLVGFFTILALILFAAVGFNFYKSWRDLF